MIDWLLIGAPLVFLAFGLAIALYAKRDARRTQAKIADLERQIRQEPHSTAS
jgi:cell division protein FtsL